MQLELSQTQQEGYRLPFTDCAVFSKPCVSPGEAGGFCCGRAPGWNPAGGHLAGNPALQRYQSSIPVAGRAQHPPARYGQGQGLLLSLIVMSTAESAWCFPSAPGKYSRSLQASWVASGL